MATESDKPISIACVKCHNQVQKSFQWLSDNAVLECPHCGRNMADERAAVIEHVESIRRVIGDFARGAGRTVAQ